MSRVRILNLPPSVTDAALTQHFSSSAKLPATAPSIQITDCMIKRAPDGRTVRMAFLGFRTVAAGQFVVKHFHNSYFGTAKIGLELATGLGDTLPSRNVAAKQKLVDQRTAKRTLPAQQELAEEQSLKKVRLEEDGADDEAKRQFVAMRMQQQVTRPSWAMEGLFTAPSLDAGPAELAVDEQRGEMMREIPISFEEKEQIALEKQKNLASVSDFDFLSSKARKPEEEEENRDEEKIVASGRTQSVEAAGSLPSAAVPIAQPTSSTPAAEEDEQEMVRRTGRIRLGNLPYSATEDDVKNFVSNRVGAVQEVHMPLTRDTKTSKGAAFVRFVHKADAVLALQSCRGAIFMGRLLRVSSAEDDPYQNAAGAGGAAGGGKSMSGFQTDKATARKETDKSGVSWNTTYMSAHTAVESVAKRLGVAGSDIVSVNAPGAAIRTAVSEAFLTSEAKNILNDEGINFEVINNASSSLLKARSNTCILVKNLTPSCDFAALVKLFSKFGSLQATAIPDTAGFAVFSFMHAQDARNAFQRIAYKNFCGAPLFLEWAPVGAIRDDAEEGGGTLPPQHKDTAAAGDDDSSVIQKITTYTIFIKNLPFTANAARFTLFLQDSCPRLANEAGWERFVSKLDVQATKGWAFLTIKDPSTFQYVLKRLQGKSFEGRLISCAASTTNAVPGSAEAASRRPDTTGEAGKHDDKDAPVPSDVPAGANPVKLIVKNLPFEATEKDLRDLFAAFTEVKSVRVPKKVHQFAMSAHRENSHRGFGFVEFLSHQEASNAMRALSSTHLYGRHLVLQYAKADDVNYQE